MMSGKLLARASSGMVATLHEPLPGRLRSLAESIIASRIMISPGGPIGYLWPLKEQ